MPLQKVVPAPGVNVQYTPTLAEGTWAASNLIRFKDGLAQKLGGWQRLLQTPVTGVARGSHAWADLSGNPYLGIGTNERLQVVVAGQLQDITPVDSTVDITPDFSTTSTSNLVTVHDAANGSHIGDWIDIVVPVSVGGLIIQGYYQVVDVIDADNYQIEASSAATATVSSGGAVPLFATTNTSASVRVTLANHGLVVGSSFNVQGSTTVATIVISGIYYVATVVGANTFDFTAATVANATTTGSENGGNVRIEYLLPSGDATATALAGYGIGPYGAGPYGMSSGAFGYSTIRQWFLDNWGENLQGNPTNGTLYQWQPPDSSVPATAIMNAPTMMTASFVSMPAQIAVALGAETGSVQDPNLIRWSSEGDNTDWTATAINQAGSFRIPTGSRIVGGRVVGQQAIIWTDVDAWTMQYVQPPFVFSFNKIAPDCGLLAGHAQDVQGDMVSWASQQGFYLYSGGGVQQIQCMVWDKFFNNYNTVQKDKIHFGSDHLFNEMFCFYPSINSDEIDSYVKLNITDNVSDYGPLVRTTWVDQSVFPYPMAVDGDGLIQQHELGYDADGQAMGESIQSAYFDLDDGSLFIFVERCIPDFVWQGSNPSIQLYVYTIEYPGEYSSPSQYGPFSIDTTTRYIIIRARGRQASLKLVGNSIGSFWRYGAIRFMTQQAGKR